VNVHVINRISNVVVAKTAGLFGFDTGPAATEGVSFLAPCGGAVELSVPVGKPGGFDLVLYLDPSGDLDRLYAVEGNDLATTDLDGLEPSIMWTNSELRDGQYVTITPETVVVSDAGLDASPSGVCKPWAYPQS
jgi:hypothetical protein